MYDLSTTDKVLIWEMLSAWDFALPGLGCELRLRAMAYLSAKGNRHKMKKEMPGLLLAFNHLVSHREETRFLARGATKFLFQKQPCFCRSWKSLWVLVMRFHIYIYIYFL